MLTLTGKDFWIHGKDYVGVKGKETVEFPDLEEKISTIVTDRKAKLIIIFYFFLSFSWTPATSCGFLLVQERRDVS